MLVATYSSHFLGEPSPTPLTCHQFVAHQPPPDLPTLNLYTIRVVYIVYRKEVNLKIHKRIYNKTKIKHFSYHGEFKYAKIFKENYKCAISVYCGSDLQYSDRKNSGV